MPMAFCVGVSGPLRSEVLNFSVKTLHSLIYAWRSNTFIVLFLDRNCTFSSGKMSQGMIISFVISWATSGSLSHIQVKTDRQLRKRKSCQKQKDCHLCELHDKEDISLPEPASSKRLIVWSPHYSMKLYLSFSFHSSFLSQSLSSDSFYPCISFLAAD